MAVKWDSTIMQLFLSVFQITGEEVAAKLEPMKAKHPQLLYESKLYRILQGNTRRVESNPRWSLASTVGRSGIIFEFRFFERMGKTGVSKTYW